MSWVEQNKYFLGLLFEKASSIRGDTPRSDDDEQFDNAVYEDDETMVDTLFSYYINEAKKKVKETLERYEQSFQSEPQLPLSERVESFFLNSFDFLIQDFDVIPNPLGKTWNTLAMSRKLSADIRLEVARVIREAFNQRIEAMKIPPAPFDKESRQDIDEEMPLTKNKSKGEDEIQQDPSILEATKNLQTLTLEEIELKNKNIFVDASLYLVNELGAFANTFIKEGRVIAYYVGMLVKEEEIDANKDLYAYEFTVKKTKLNISPIAPYNNHSENRLNKAPFCLAAFANDPKGTHLSQTGIFSSSPCYKVAGHKNMYAVEVLAVEDLDQGDEIVISYGNNYWKQAIYKPSDKELFDEKGPYINGQDRESKQMPFRFYSYSIMNFSKINQTLIAKKYELGPKTKWKDSDWEKYKRQILKGAMEYSLDSTDASPQHMWNYEMNEIMKRLDLILHFLLKLKKYRFITQSPAALRLGLFQKLNRVISNYPLSEIEESVSITVAYDSIAIQTFLCTSKPEEGTLCDFIKLLEQEKFLTVFNADKSNHEAYVALERRIDSERKSSYSLGNTLNLMTFVMLCFEFLELFAVFVDTQSKISAEPTTTRKSSRRSASNIEDTFI